MDAYNGLLTVAEDYKDSGSGNGGRLLNDVGSVARNRSESLKGIGLIVADNGYISIDSSVLAEAITPQRTQDTFQRLSEFKDAIGQKADNASVNPMKYVDKVVVEYKNPGHTFAAPYMSSHDVRQLHLKTHQIPSVKKDLMGFLFPRSCNRSLRSHRYSNCFV